MLTQVTRIRRYALIISVVWTALLTCSLAWFYFQQRNSIIEIAKAEARITFQKDTLYRKWAASHGGVYVPVDDQTSPSHYLMASRLAANGCSLIEIGSWLGHKDYQTT